MRTCLSWLRKSPFRTSSSISPQTLRPNTAVKHLSNAQLLELLKEGNDNATSTPDTHVARQTIEPQAQQMQSPASLIPPPHNLPKSPLVDPYLAAARTRHRAGKPRQSKNLTPLQTKLRKNPYGIFDLILSEARIVNFNAAQALATPIRQCFLTGVRLPSFFQFPFGLKTHPATGSPWHLPRIYLGAVPNDSEPPSLQNDRNDITQSQIQNKHTSKGVPAATPIESERTVSGTHLVASRHALKHILGLKRIQYLRMMPWRWKGDASLKGHEIIWREDMDTFVLELSRKIALQTLKYLASRPAAYIVACKGYDSIEDHEQVAAVLWLGDDSCTRSESEHQDAFVHDVSKAARRRDLGPPSYSMARYRSNHIPIYNLYTLLGPVQLLALRQSSMTHFGGTTAVIKSKQGTVKLQLELWKLIGYLS